MPGPPPEMTCRELVEAVTLYVEDALGETDRARFEAHLADCHPCGEYIGQYRTTIAVAARLEPDELSAESRDEVLRAFRDWRADRS